MAIHFKKLYYKNFLSTGNAGTTIYLDKTPTTLIQGTSGSGKSTIIDALCFGLFGKAFRNINKPQLVNSINQKHCEVHVEFSTNGRNYTVIRGIKPAKFDILCDDKLVTQDAAVKDYQNVLEQQILMMSFKTFTQIVILGSTAYTPFMQLTPAARREVIEDILDIGIFSTMNLLLKQKTQETKEQQILIDSNIKAQKEKADGVKRLIDVLSTKRDEELEEFNREYANVQKEIDTIESQIEELKNANNALKTKTINQSVLKEEYELCTKHSIELVHENKKANTQLSLINDHSECPSCKQEISDAYKKTMEKSISKTIKELQKQLASNVELRTKKKQEIDDLQILVDQILTNTNKCVALGSNLDILQKRLLEILDSIESRTSNHHDVDELKKELKVIANDAFSMVKMKKDLAEQRQIEENASLLLRDSGIKSAIIKEYLPIINKLINKYLAELELFIEFHLNENFDEEIKSRHRDTFTYGNFSEGEKLRIDLSLLFAWRHIAKLKNSSSCNLLILDEILVGRLDQTNTDIVINMISQLAHEGTNIFAIAHHDSLQDKFRGLIQFKKEGDFSVVL